jgi:hypothetical protein
MNYKGKKIYHSIRSLSQTARELLWSMTYYNKHAHAVLIEYCTKKEGGKFY